jgi:hypothetical protein
VAKLYGEIMRDLGVLSKGDFQLRCASDLVGSALGESEKKTNAVLAASKGCILCVDEFYSLGSGSQKTDDPYRRAVIDVIVEKVQPSGDADRVVLLLGYKVRDTHAPNELIRRDHRGGGIVLIIACDAAWDGVYVFDFDNRIPWRPCFAMPILA